MKYHLSVIIFHCHLLLSLYSLYLTASFMPFHFCWHWDDFTQNKKAAPFKRTTLLFYK